MDAHEREPLVGSRARFLFRAPISGDGERAPFQRRAAFTLLLIFILSFGFWMATVGLHPFIGRVSIAALFRGPVSTAHLATSFAALFGWLALRVRPWSAHFLDATDLLFTVALGVTYFLLTGERVFDGANLVEICSGHLHREPPRPSDLAPGIPHDLDAIILSCLAKKVEARPQSARELLSRLSTCGVSSWTPEDAEAWWCAVKVDAKPPSSVRSDRGASVLGATITIDRSERPRLVPEPAVSRTPSARSQA